MLPKLSRGLRLALMLTLSVGYVGWHGHTHAAFAKGGDDDGGDDSGDDPDEKGGEDKGDGDGDDGPEEGQPPVTAGGLFTMKTYPVSELLRPLTMTQGITQLRLALGTDLSAKGAFGTFGANLEGIYGVTDNFSVIGGLTNAYNFKQFGFYAGFEGALAYDLLDIRVAANLHRSALPDYENFCSPVTASDPKNPQDPATCGAGANATLVNLPNGNYQAGNSKLSIDLGFPFRYAIKPEIAIIALQTLMSIDFNSARRDHVVQSTSTMDVPDGMGGTTSVTTVTNAAVANGIKPDLKPSIGIALNPVPALSVVVFAQLIIPDFDTSAGAFQIPLTGRVEFSPSQQLDIGLEFVLLNVKPPDPQSPIDNRFLSLFVQARY